MAPRVFRGRLGWSVTALLSKLESVLRHLRGGMDASKYKDYILTFVFAMSGGPRRRDPMVLTNLARFCLTLA